MFRFRSSCILGFGLICGLICSNPFLLGQSVSSVQRILIDASRVHRTQPYVDQLYDADLQRILDCGPNAIPELIQELREASPDSIKLSLLLDAIAKWKDARALPTILELLNDKQIRWHRGTKQLYDAFAALGNNAEESLISIATDVNSNQRAGALQALIHLGAMRAGDVFLKTLKRREPTTLEFAISGVVQSKVEGGEAELLLLLKEELASTDVVDPKSTVSKPPRGRLLQSDDLDSLLLALGQCGGTESVERLLPLVNDKTFPLRHSAVIALGNLNDARVVEPLMMLLEEAAPKENAVEPAPNEGMRGPPPPTLRELSVRGLVTRRDISLPALISAAKTPRTLRGSGAIQALARMAAPETESLLRASFEMTDASEAAHADALYALCTIGTEQSADALLRASRETRAPETATRVAAALARIGPNLRTKLREQMQDTNAFAGDIAYVALCQIGDERDFDALAREPLLAENAGRYLKFDAFRELAMSKPCPTFRDALWNLAKSNSSFATQAVGLLSEYPDTNASEVSDQAISMLAGRLHDWQILQLLAALERTGLREQRTKPLIGLLKNGHPNIQSAVAKVLAKHSCGALLQTIQQEPGTALAAINSLKEYRDTPFVQETVIAALRDEHLRMNAIDILVEWKAADPIVRFLFDHLEDNAVTNRTEAALSALSRIPETGFIDQLMQRKSRFIDLSRFGMAATEAMITDLHHFPEALGALGTIGDPKAAPAIVAFLNDESKSDWHYLAAIALGNVGTSLGAEALFNRLENPGRISTHFLWESIAKLPRSLRLKGLRKLVQVPHNVELSLQAVRELVSIGTQDSLKVLKEQLAETKSERIRIEIENALKKL